MKTFLILVAGGTGTRMGSELPKQFIELNGKPVIYYAIQQFINSVPDISIVISIHPIWKNKLNEILNHYFPEVKFLIADGGETRFHSVKNGLNLIKEEGVVCIHDAARPLVSNETITRCLAETFKSGNAIPVICISESLRKVANSTSIPLNRDEIRVVQTPQCFTVTEIKKAFEQAYTPAFTDDASVLESFGKKINLVDGNPENIKITISSDLNYAEFVLKNKNK
jgi:2-C-methyl-D-erythritol 4-phosphate cytidylyltransferase